MNDKKLFESSIRPFWLLDFHINLLLLHHIWKLGISLFYCYSYEQNRRQSYHFNRYEIMSHNYEKLGFWFLFDYYHGNMPTCAIIYSDSYRLICELLEICTCVTHCYDSSRFGSALFSFFISICFWIIVNSQKNPSAYQSKGQVCKKCYPLLLQFHGHKLQFRLSSLLESLTKVLFN